jgi:hypothetical protein
VNGDGFDDVLIASPGRLFFEEDGSVTNTSRLSLFHGRAAEAEALALTTAEADLTVHPINDEKWLGGSDLARENDFDGDGVRDFRTSAKEFSIDANGILSWEDPEYILSGVDLSILNAVRVAPADPFDAGDAGDADDADAVGEPEAVMLPGDVDGDGDVDEMDLTDIVGRVGRATYAGRG